MEKITKFEKTRILGLRATHIANGAKPVIDVGDLKDPLKIAEKEYYSGKIPISIIRTLPNGKKIRIDILSN